MGVEPKKESYIRDSEAFACVVGILERVAAAPSEIKPTDRDQYAQIVNILDPVSGSFRDDALLVPTLEALTGAISKINPEYHASLLRNLFSLCLWNYGLHTREVILKLIISMAAVPDNYLKGCLQMVVANFRPFRQIRNNKGADESDIHDELYLALCHITDLVPRAPLMLSEVIGQNMPRVTDSKEIISAFVKCMLKLENGDLGQLIGGRLLTKVVELLVDMDVNIHWKNILQEDPNNGVFDLELEDGDENPYSTEGKAIAKKLDSLMVIVFNFLTEASCQTVMNGRKSKLVQVFEILTEAFFRTVMNAYKSKFAQFVMFYACSLEPENCGRKFAHKLRDIFVSNTQDPISRMSSISYLASFLARANFVPTSLVAEILESLVDWCLDYYEKHQFGGMVYLRFHRVFYSGCQAVIYILCFHMRYLVDARLMSPLLKFEPILQSSFNPLKVCLPIIAKEFVLQSKAGKLFQAATTYIDQGLLDSEFSKAFGGTRRLDMFFPFDPYLLKESDRFIKPIFQEWSMVKKRYDDPNSEYEVEELDAPEDDQLIEGHNESDSFSEKSDDSVNDDDVEIELGLNEMSITPKPTFDYLFENNFANGTQMPARLRPSIG